MSSPVASAVPHPRLVCSRSICLQTPGHRARPSGGWFGGATPSSLPSHFHTLSPAPCSPVEKQTGAWPVVPSDGVFHTGLEETHDNSLGTLQSLYLWPEACSAERSPVSGRALQKWHGVCAVFLGGLPEISEPQHWDPGPSEAHRLLSHDNSVQW